MLRKGIIQDGAVIKTQGLPEVTQSGGSRLVGEEAISSWHSFVKSSLEKKTSFQFRGLEKSYMKGSNENLE